MNNQEKQTLIMLSKRKGQFIGAGHDINYCVHTGVAKSLKKKGYITIDPYPLGNYKIAHITEAGLKIIEKE